MKRFVTVILLLALFSSAKTFAQTVNNRRGTLSEFVTDRGVCLFFSFSTKKFDSKHLPEIPGIDVGQTQDHVLKPSGKQGFKTMLFYPLRMVFDTALFLTPKQKIPLSISGDTLLFSLPDSLNSAKYRVGVFLRDPDQPTNFYPAKIALGFEKKGDGRLLLKNTWFAGMREKNKDVNFKIVLWSDKQKTTEWGNYTLKTSSETKKPTIK